MALNIKNARTHELAARLASVTGESITEAVTRAIEERLGRVERRLDPEYVQRELEKIQAWFREQPVRDPRSGDEMLYGDDGLPR
ncbi:MAG: type II toxin-antitoxin system VapB family antitoxin [Gemmatimonadaceae bacterium]|jgi:antitoxin VapB|nr:type II toxin-antitoxin system VapB family antitoxin [Gemmatimonadaceae bacterium]